MIGSDLHIHSSFSVDSKTHLFDMCRAAIEKEIPCICFTEHVDLNPVDAGFGVFNPGKYDETFKRAQDKFGSRIRLLKGIEFGEPHRYEKEFETALAGDYDQIIGSVHWLGEDFAGAIKPGLSLEQAFEHYYGELLQTARYGGFDILAHLDFPKRYFKSGFVDSPLVDDILKEIVKKEIALEINTSTLRKGLDECAPNAEVVDRYARFGGRRITIGSDAHVPKEIGADFDRALSMIEGKGLELGCFVKRTFEAVSGVPGKSKGDPLDRPR